jgi:putative Mg2+ transporter-C (MgtC) family protein
MRPALTDQLIVVGRVALAAFLGFVIGIERNVRGKEAGDRTFALLALGSATFVGLGLTFFPHADHVIQGVAAGVGFLGAGIIFRSESGTRGLTTAAATWATASIGALAGAGLWLVATLITLIVVFVLEVDRVGFIRRFDRYRHDDEDGEDSP